MYKQIASAVFFLAVTAAVSAQPAGPIPEPITRPPVADDAPPPDVLPVPLPPDPAELPPPRPVPSVPPLFKMSPATPSREVEALLRELDQLRKENDSMLKGRRGVDPSDAARPGAGGDAETSLELRMRLADKLAQLRKIREDALAKNPPAPPASAKGPAPAAKGPVSPLESAPPTHEAAPEKEAKEAPVDAPGLGRVLFLSGDYAKALATYAAIDAAEQRPEDRLVTQYMTACCLRKLGKLDEAAALYREVGNSGGHESLAANAQWHLQTMKGHQELVAELARLRALREGLTRREP